MASQNEYKKHGVVIKAPSGLQVGFRFILPQFKDLPHESLKEGVHYFTTITALRAAIPDPADVCSFFKSSSQEIEDQDASKRCRKPPRKFFSKCDHVNCQGYPQNVQTHPCLRCKSGRVHHICAIEITEEAIFCSEKCFNNDKSKKKDSSQEFILVDGYDLHAFDDAVASTVLSITPEETKEEQEEIINDQTELDSDFDASSSSESEDDDPDVVLIESNLAKHAPEHLKKLLKPKQLKELLFSIPPSLQAPEDIFIGDPKAKIRGLPQNDLAYFFKLFPMSQTSTRMIRMGKDMMSQLKRCYVFLDC
jgi:hypothetical protein